MTTRQLVQAELIRQWPRLAALFALMLLGAGLGVIAPLLYRRLIDTALPAVDLAQIGWLAAGLVAAPVAGLALSAVQQYLLADIGVSVTDRLRARVFARVLRADLAAAEAVPSAEIVHRLTRACGQIGLVYITDLLLPLLANVLLLIGYLIAMFTVSWPLALVASVAVPLTYGLGRWLLRFAFARDADYYRVIEAGQSFLQQVIAGLRLVRAANGRPVESARWRAWLAEHGRAHRRTHVVHYSYLFYASTVNSLLAGVTFGLGALLVATGHISLGGLVAIGFYVPAAYAALKVIFQGHLGLSEARANAVQLDALLALPLEPSGSRRLPGPPGAGVRVAFQDVSFTYGRGDFALEQLSFVAEPGELVGIVGATGGGKTTVLDLLLGFYRPQAGTIMLDGVNLRELSLPAVRAVTSLVPQDVFLWDASLHDNLTYPARAVPAEAVSAAAHAAQLADFITGLPEGYVTRVGERGQALSGGERQRLALGRAFLRQPRLLLLDEATSALDALTEAQLRAALDRLRPGRTLIVVAHRLATVINADRILVLDHGRLIESGPPAALLAQGGLFSRLYRAQQLELHQPAANP